MIKRIICVIVTVCLLGGCIQTQVKETAQVSTPSPTPTPLNLVDLTIRDVNDEWLSAPSLFEGEFKSSWTLNSGDGSASVEASYLQQKVIISHGGSSASSISLSRQGFNLTKGNSYIISFDVTGSLARSIQLIIKNPNTNEVFASYDIPLNANETKNQRISYQHKGGSLYDAMIGFEMGAVSDYHEIQLSNITLVDVDGGNQDVKVNQVGYGKNDSKRALFSYNEGDFFNLVDETTKQVVYQGPIILKGYDQDSHDTVFYGDFSEFTTPGTYHIETQIGGSSVPFTIDDYPYDTLMGSLLYVLYNQRCGQEITSSIDDFSHSQCHTHLALLPDGLTLDVSGGWHDAGDYGRYVNTGAKSALDLLLAYEVAPFHFLDNLNIDESGNGVADILDEAKYELSWIMKMQTVNGSFYTKVATQKFADLNVSAEKDSDDLYIKGENRTDIAALAGATLIYASHIYQTIDPDFANQCKESALRAYDFIKGNEKASIIDILEEGFTQGVYNDTDDTDQRFLFASAMYYVLDQRSYYDDALTYLMDESISLSGTGWREVGGYGLYFLAKSNLSQSDSTVIDTLYQRMNDNVVLIGNAITGNAYNYSNEGYGWGSNGEVADDALYLALVYDVSASDAVQDIAYSAIAYLLGRNALNMCFVVGYGTNSPHLIHHRMTIAHQSRYIGALVGGPDAYCEDEISKQQCNTVPPAKAYYDNIDSYSTNEMSIYWNSALLAALAILNS